MSIPIINDHGKGTIALRSVNEEIKWNYRRLGFFPFGICLGQA